MKYLFHIILCLGLALPSFAQEFEVKGKVYDAYTSNPLVDVTVMSSLGKGTVTNTNGEFTLMCFDTSTITIRHISYESFTYKASDHRFINVGLIPSINNLNEVSIQTSKDEANPNLKQAQAIAIITPERLNREEGLNMDRIVNLEPGIYAMASRIPGSIGDGVTGLSSDLKIRGYVGYRNSGGYKMYLNGIPITDAEGGAQHGDVDYSIVGKMEIIKGPSSSLYGTGIGGAIKLFTKQPEPQSTKITQQATVGSYGLLRTNTRLESATNNSSIILNYGHQYYKGWIPETENQKEFVTFAGTFRPNEKQSFFVYASYADAVGNKRAPSLDSTDYFNQVTPESEDEYIPLSEQEHTENYRIGVSHTYKFTNWLNNTTSVFASGQDRDESNIGGRTEFNATFGGDIIKVKGTVGNEIQRSLSSSIKYNDLDDGTDGALNTYDDYTAFQNNTFGQLEFHLPHNFILTAGLSYNLLEFSIVDHLGYEGNPSDKESNTGYKRFDPIVTPRLALLKTFKNNFSIYANYSQGYSPYGMGKTIVIPYLGEVNNDLTPEFATLYEIGTKGSIFNKKLSYQLAIFKMDITDKITTQSVYNDQEKIIYSYYTNTGSQIDNGLELSLTYALIDNEIKAVRSLVPFVSFTYSDFYYDGFKSDANDNKETIDYSGNQAVGVPPVLISAGFDLDLKWGIYLNSSYRYVSDMYGDYENEHVAEGYYLLNAKIGYKRSFGQHWDANIAVGGNNLTNQLYYVGGGSSRSPLGTAYSPAPYTATFYGQFSCSYKF